MIYGSVCSGIEAATQAWHPLGWSPAFFAEIEKFPSRVLAHHYGSNLPGEAPAGNGVPNHGDMTKFEEWPDHAIDLLVGGTPCQSFSVAGLRQGLADPRGNLMLTYLAIARRYQPRWLVWENVPGVLSSNGGRDFGTFIRGLEECGYHAAWRVLDAQYVRIDGLGRAVPQRRRRVFVVGYLGDWRRAAAVLFEPEGLRGDPPPRREAGQGSASTIGGGPDGGRITGTVSSKWSKGSGGPAGDEAYNLVGLAVACDVADTLSVGANQTTGLSGDVIAALVSAVAPPPLTGNPYGDHESREGMLVAHSLRAEGFDASEDGTRRGTPLVPVKTGFQGDALVTPDMARPCLSAQGGNNGGGPGAVLVAPTPIAFSAKDHGGDAERDLSPTLRAGGHSGSHANAGVMPAIAFTPQNDGGDACSEFSPTLRVGTSLPDRGEGMADCHSWAVRRLTPLECERLQGFQDGFTAIPGAADGPRYKALGNSMAVNCMRWIGMRIDHVERIAAERAAA